MALFDQSSADVSGSPVDVNLLLFFSLVLIGCLSPGPCWMCGSVLSRFDIQAVWGFFVCFVNVNSVHWCCRWGAVTHLCCVTLLWFISPCCLYERVTSWQLLDLCVSPWQCALLCSCAVLCECVCEWMVVLSDCINKWKVFCRWICRVLSPCSSLSTLLCLTVASFCVTDEDPLQEDGSHSCVHCGLPQHSKEPGTQKPSL